MPNTILWTVLYDAIPSKGKTFDDRKLRNFSQNAIMSDYRKCLKFLVFTEGKETSNLSEKVQGLPSLSRN